MTPYEKIEEEKRQKEEDKRVRTASLEKQLKTWKARQTELRKTGSTALDPGFIRRQLAKCDAEIKRINDILAGL